MPSNVEADAPTASGSPGRWRWEEDGPWLTVGEVAALLKVHPNTVRRLILTGRLPAARLGGRGSPVRISAEHLDAFMRDALITPGPTADTDTAHADTTATDTAR